jgi:prevent-host-death family protein
MASRKGYEMDARPTEFGAADAKARFAELLARAEAGETITIRRHGRAVAKLVPAAMRELTPEERRKSWEEWVAYRRKHNITLGPDLTIKQLIEEGRRY